MGQRLCFLLADGVEEIEAVVSLDILRRAGLSVLTVAVGENCTVRGAHEIDLVADGLLSAMANEEFSGLIIPGGPASFSLRKNAVVLTLVSRMKDKFLAAICAAPLILLDAGALEGRRHTAHPSVHKELPQAETAAIVEDGNLITGSGPGAAIPFALAIVRYFSGATVSGRVARSLDV